MFEGQLEMENGYIKVDEHMNTSVAGVFAAGEAADPHFRQVVTSAGMGAAAAIEATHFLERETINIRLERCTGFHLPVQICPAIAKFMLVKSYLNDLKCYIKLSKFKQETL